MKKHFILKSFLALFIIFSLVINAALPAYGLFDRVVQSANNPTIKTGTWIRTIPIENLSEELFDSFSEIFPELYDNPDFQKIMDVLESPSNNSDVEGFSVNGITIGNMTWQFDGLFDSPQNRETVGFLRVINRNTPLLPLVPLEEDIFTAYDIRNTITDNAYSIRLEGKSQLTTEVPLSNLESLSFYAVGGMKLNNENINYGRDIIVSYSSDGINFTVLDTQTILTPSPEVYFSGTYSMAFREHIFDFSGLNEVDPLYIRIEFIGGLTGSGNNQQRSRVVIDELTINQSND